MARSDSRGQTITPIGCWWKPTRPMRRSPTGTSPRLRNSVLEHIPHVQAVLDETAASEAGGSLSVCVPNDEFHGQPFDCRGPSIAWTERPCGRLPKGLRSDLPARWPPMMIRGTGKDASRPPDFRSRHIGTTSHPSALAALEWGAIWGFRRLSARRSFGRWILRPRGGRACGSQWLLFTPVYNEPVPDKLGPILSTLPRHGPLADAAPSLDQ